MEQTKKNMAPINACIFTEIPVQFADDDTDNDFYILAYSGEIIPNHWYWGNLAWDIKGMKFAKKKTPVTEEHISSSRIGFASKQQITEKVEFWGKYLSNDNAVALKKDMKDGFPMEASLYLPPLIIEKVEQGQTTKVNGKILEGPGTVFRKSIIREVSMVLFGAAVNTMSKAFDDGGKQEVDFEVINSKEKQMSEKKEPQVDELTAETFAAEHPDIFAGITADGNAEGQKEVRELFNKFAEKFGEDPAFVIEQFKGNLSIEQATEKYAQKMKEQRDEALKKAKEASKNKVDPAYQEFSDDQGIQTTKEEPADTEEGWKKEFAESKELQAEFRDDEKAYIAFKKAEKEGKVRRKS